MCTVRASFFSKLFIPPFDLHKEVLGFELFEKYCYKLLCRKVSQDLSLKTFFSCFKVTKIVMNEIANLWLKTECDEMKVLKKSNKFT